MRPFACTPLLLLLGAALVGGLPTLLEGHSEHHHHGSHGDHAFHGSLPSAQSGGGVPDLTGDVITTQVGSLRTVPAAPAPAAAHRNPFFSSDVQLPVFTSPPRTTPKPTPPPLLNVNPLGGPSGFKGPVRASCPGPASALPCVPDVLCDPFSGFLKSDGYPDRLPYPVTKNTPTVSIDQCLLPGGAIGVCCKKFPDPPKPTRPTASPTSVPLGGNYGEGLDDLRPKPTRRPVNPFLPNYNPTG